jgi:hypothetical protein
MKERKRVKIMEHRTLTVGWISIGEIVGKYIIPAHIVHKAGKQEEIPEAHMFKCYKSFEGIEFETNVKKEIYDDAEIGDIYIFDLTVEEKYKEKIIKISR